jgi:hypothetical protein
LIFQIGIENNTEGRSIAWDLEHPGCFAYGQDGNNALIKMRDAVINYNEWITKHNNGQTWVKVHEEMDIQHAETWETYLIDENYDRSNAGYEVNAWFLYDWKPLTGQDIERGNLLLNWSRDDILQIVDGIDPGTLHTSYPGERWSIDGILKHVAGAEWWYMDRLGLTFPQEELPEESFKRVEAARSHLMQVLPSLTNTEQVLGVDGELWSPRKMLRRAVWHERDHTSHIQKLLEY